jgi:hemerythrin
MDYQFDAAAKDELNKTLVWSSEYSVGVTELDHDHMMVFNAINQFKNGIRLKYEIDFVEQLFTMLLEHADAHFRAEEQHMAKIGYAGLEPHKAEHQAMKQELDKLYAKFQAGGAAAVGDLLVFLNSWWLRHITEDDAKYKT